jgi:hypothetical protein
VALAPAPGPAPTGADADAAAAADHEICADDPYPLLELLLLVDVSSALISRLKYCVV